MLRVAVEIRASISVPSMGAFRTGVFTSFCRALVLHREGQVGVTLGSLSSIAAAYNWTWGLECLLFTTMYLTCQDLAHSRCLIFPESVNTWVELLWVFYLETSIPKEEEKEEKGRGRGEEGGDSLRTELNNNCFHKIIGVQSSKIRSKLGFLKPTIISSVILKTLKKPIISWLAGI